MSRNGAATAAKPKRAKKCDDFRYGWRYVDRVGPDGKVVNEAVPLTLEDVLHPQEGDTIPENTQQNRERDYLRNVLHRRRSGLRRARVFSDCIINWGVSGMRNHSPDISVFENVADLERDWGVFPVRQQGANPRLALELVSPSTRDNDVVIKFAHYHRIQVPVYVIVDQEEEDGPRTLVGYRWTRRRYVPMRPDRRGRLLLRDFGIRIGLVDNSVVCYDAETDEVIGDYEQLADAREAAEAARQAEAAARQAAEDRVRELEEQLRQLRSPGS